MDGGQRDDLRGELPPTQGWAHVSKPENQLIAVHRCAAGTPGAGTVTAKHRGGGLAGRQAGRELFGGVDGQSVSSFAPQEAAMVAADAPAPRPISCGAILAMRISHRASAFG